MREYVVVLLTAGLVTYLATPVVRLAAVRLRMMAAPRERDVHVIPTPRGGGVAMYLGVAAAILVATRLPALQRTFDDSQTAAVLIAGGLICALGVLDDKFGLDALTKLTGQIAAAGVMVLLGVQLLYVFLPVAVTAPAASMRPTSIDPESPMKMRAGLKLCGRKPRQAPARTAVISVGALAMSS